MDDDRYRMIARDAIFTAYEEMKKKRRTALFTEFLDHALDEKTQTEIHALVFDILLNHLAGRAELWELRLKSPQSQDTP